MSETLPLLRAKHVGGAGCCEGGALVGGGRTIGWFGSIALVVNNISGPGMLEFPAAFQAAGWVPSLAVLVAVWALSSLSASLLSGAMRSMPGNGRFQRRVEFSDVFMHYMGRRWATATHAAFFLCLMAQNVAAIVATAQVVDAAIAAYLPFPTAALQLWPSPEVVVWDGQEVRRCCHRCRPAQPDPTNSRPSAATTTATATTTEASTSACRSRGTALSSSRRGTSSPPPCSRPWGRGTWRRTC